MTVEERNKPEIIMFGDIVEDNGKTIRENNLAKAHTYQLGDIVEVDLDLTQPGSEEGIEICLQGTCRLFVVGHMRDCDETPLYVISDIPVKFPLDSLSFSRERLVYRTLAKVVESGYSEDSLRPTGMSKSLSANPRSWMMPDEAS